MGRGDDDLNDLDELVQTVVRTVASDATEPRPGTMEPRDVRSVLCDDGDQDVGAVNRAIERALDRGLLVTTNDGSLTPADAAERP
ncbi:hypothetical protein ACFQPA_21225 [Halomarina halobia]|uniref:MarR family transcriptional regulator n=1 Tax=Halomarina halobia TaxID=3033386 RepID=A0ABD6AG21_9EURY|nr:hypothetical protein [Halomarina sp. PSR21]